MRFSGFDVHTNRMLFDVYDEALTSLSTDPALSLYLIYRCENAMAQRLTELATQGVREGISLRDAAMKVVFEARATEVRSKPERPQRSGSTP